MEQIRQDMVEGKPIDGCESCYNIERSGHESWRQWKYNKLYEHDTVVNRVGLKLRINGSYCNLSCYMCFPYNSSTRRNELKKVGVDWSEYDAGYVGVKSGQYERIIDDILKNIHLVDYMNITGGEPMIHKNLSVLVEAIHKTGRIVSIECSGSYWVDVPEYAYITLSPKEHISPKFPVLPIFWEKAHEYKLVVFDKSEFNYYKDRVKNFKGLKYLSPEHESETSNQYAVELLLQNKDYKNKECI